MSIGMSILTVMISFIGMECMAWFSHKYIMHGFLWKLHKDHHQKTNHWWELKDIFVIAKFKFVSNSNYDYYTCNQGIDEFTISSK